MLNLMRLEMKKYQLGSYVKAAIIANFVIAGFMFMILFISKIEEDSAIENYQIALTVIDSFVRGVFIVFAATLIAKLIIGEYKNRTITTAFMYPIKRKKLIAAKLAIVIIFTFVAIIVSNVFITTIFCLVSTTYQLIPDTLTTTVIMQQIPSMFMNAIAATGMSLIPLYFGMKKYSIPTTILSSLLIVMVVSSNTGNFSLNDIIVIPITLAIIGIIIAYLSIRNIESVDV
ncbi:ABC transporter permease subunit [Lysinibacillus parviboronicapiens]|uniref:ABC transporter permease subunit n=1 Tax=Lysinibacillus parviboronicapiens TaxID=436516 RepID=UPI000D392939|nr:ABC transporter permease subunit [Lysinibacillus parviboronicapiens]